MFTARLLRGGIHHHPRLFVRAITTNLLSSSLPLPRGRSTVSLPPLRCLSTTTTTRLHVPTELPIDDGAGQRPLHPARPSRPLHPSSSGPHDVGGLEEFIGASIDLQEGDTECSHWELQTHALLVCLVGRSIITVDELRRGVEGLPEDTYRDWGYYGKWAASMATGKGYCLYAPATLDSKSSSCILIALVCLLRTHQPPSMHRLHPFSPSHICAMCLFDAYLCNAPV